MGLQWVDVQLVMCALRDGLAVDTRDDAVRQALVRLGGRGDPRG
jgi:hypothetical protein